MKTLFLSLLVMFIITGCGEDETDSDQIISFADQNFKSILVNDNNINTNNDDEISESEALAYSGGINAPNQSIQNVVGIEYFENITKVSLFGNSLTSIDLSNNTKVRQLLIEKNNLTSLDISKLTVLTDVKAHSNKFTVVNVANGNNSNMTRMEVQNNSGLTCIKVDVLPVPSNGWVKDDDASYSTNCN